MVIAKLNPPQRAKLAAAMKRWRKRRSKLVALCDDAEKALDQARRALERAEECATHAAADLGGAPLTAARLRELCSQVEAVGMAARRSGLIARASVFQRDGAVLAVRAGKPGHTGGV